MTGFHKKVSIIMKHDYFGSSQVSGLNLLPTTECLRLLRNYQLLLKNTADGWDIYGEEDEDTAFAYKLPAATLAFDFLLLLEDKLFLKYTSLPPKRNDEVYLLSNEKGKAVLQFTTTQRVQSFNNGALEVLGVLRLYFNFSEQATLVLNFTAPQLKWRYYVLTSATFPDHVIDGGSAGITFNKQSETLRTADKIGVALAAGYPSAIISVYESEKAIPVSNTGRKNIQLKKLISNAIIISHLPNPDPGENGIKIINLLN